MHYGVFDEKCAGCGKEIRHIEDIELSIGSEHFCNDCVSFCDICGEATPLKYLTQKTDYNGRFVNVCPSCCEM